MSTRSGILPAAEIRPGDPFPRFLVAVSVSLFAVVLLRTAWVCDDAYITFRTIANFLRGDGLVYNVGERVQSYTHPLWMFLLAAAQAVTGVGSDSLSPIYFVALAISILVSLSAFGLLSARIASPGLGQLLAMTALLFSQAFVDYSTSGLENPLSHLIVIVFLSVFLLRPSGPRKLLLLAGLTSAGFLARPDLILVFLVPLLVEILQAARDPETGLRRAAGAVARGLLPIAGWEAFSLFYYGSLVPNSFYSHLPTGVPKTLLVRQGFLYFLSSLNLDPVTLLVTVSGVALALLARDARRLAVAAGIVLYLAYVTFIGGDFMNGRFLTVPLLLAVVIVSGHPRLSEGSPGLITLGVVLAVGMTSSSPPIRSDENFGRPVPTPDRRGVIDERAFYYQGTGLLRAGRGFSVPDHKFVDEGRRYAAAPKTIVVVGATGLAGFHAGPRIHVIDVFAVVDPLLARLPIPDPTDWRIGHFERNFPDGYWETLKTGENRIADPVIARLYDRLALVTRGRLSDPARLKAIWEVNFR
jgi:arabinofuranosyltransferase